MNRELEKLKKEMDEFKAKFEEAESNKDFWKSQYETAKERYERHAHLIITCQDCKFFNKYKHRRKKGIINASWCLLKNEYVYKSSSICPEFSEKEIGSTCTSSSVREAAHCKTSTSLFNAR